MITRSTGTPVTVLGIPYHVGAGYWGKTAELDAIVQRAAEMLDAAFSQNVEIRFNCDRESGGAFINPSGTGGLFQDFGLTAGLYHIRPQGMTDDEWWDKDRAFKDAQPQEVRIDTFISSICLKDPASAKEGPRDSKYDSKEHPTLEAGLAYLKAQVRTVWEINIALSPSAVATESPQGLDPPPRAK